MSATKTNLVAPLSPRFTKLGIVNEDIANSMTQSFESGKKIRFGKALQQVSE